MSTDRDPRKALMEAVTRLHDVPARWLETVPVNEIHSGKTVWEGEVEVFELEGHPEADRCYAWESETDGGKVRTYAVLGKPPIDTPAAAVRAAIVADHKTGRGMKNPRTTRDTHEPVTCGNCEGHGRVPAEKTGSQAPPAGKEDAGMVACPVCRGTGRLPVG